MAPCLSCAIRDGLVPSVLTPCWVRDGPCRCHGGNGDRSVLAPRSSVFSRVNPLWCRVGSGLVWGDDFANVVGYNFTSDHPGSRDGFGVTVALGKE